MIRRVLPIALLLTAAGLSMAQAQPAQPDLNALVAPFVDDQTLLVGHVDMNRVDTDALLQLAINALDAAKIPADDPVRTRVTAMKRLADDYLTQFKALGGRHVFVLLAQQDLVPTPSGPGILIPLEPGASAPAMVTFLRTRLNMQDISDVGNNRVLIARGVTLTRLTHLQPQKRDDLSLLTTADAPPVEAVVSLTADQRRVIKELLPTLPARFGGGSTEAVTDGLKSISIRMQLPPDLKLTVNFAHTDASGAEEMRKLLATVKELLLADEGMKQAATRPATAEMATAARRLINDLLTPKAVPAGALATTLELSAQQVRDATSAVLVPGVNRARQQAARVTMMSGMRQGLIAIIMYANDNRGILPTTTDQLASYLKQPVADALKNPNDPKGRPFIFRPPAGEMAKVQHPETTPVLWEDSDSPDGIGVGFLDGHVEFVNRARLETVLKSAATTQPKRDLP